MTPKLALLVLMSVSCDVMAQLFFKIGVDGLNRRTTHSPLAFLWQGFGEPWLYAGVGAYLGVFVLWSTILSDTPLSLAFPLISLSYCGVVLVSRVFLKERVSKRRWLGALLITIGVAIVGASAGGL